MTIRGIIEMRSFSPCGPDHFVVLENDGIYSPGIETRLGLGQPSRDEMQAIAPGGLDSITGGHANVGTWFSQR